MSVEDLEQLEAQLPGYAKNLCRGFALKTECKRLGMDGELTQEWVNVGILLREIEKLIPYRNFVHSDVSHVQRYERWKLDSEDGFYESLVFLVFLLIMSWLTFLFLQHMGGV
jgi:hypothetical protein